MENTPTGALVITYRPSAPVVAVIGVPTSRTLADGMGCLVFRSVTIPVMRARLPVGTADVAGCACDMLGTDRNARTPKAAEESRPTR